LRVEVLSKLPDLLALQASAPSLFPCLLESTTSPAANARWNLLFATAAQPILVGDGEVHGQFSKLLQTQLADVVRRISLDDLPFSGGFIAYLSYETAAEFEPSLRMPSCSHGQPRAALIRTPVAVAVDRIDGRALLIGEESFPELFDRVKAAIAEPINTVIGHQEPFLLESEDPQKFSSGIEEIQEYLRNGDVFQVNYSRSWIARSSTWVVCKSRAHRPSVWFAFAATKWTLGPSLALVPESLATTNKIACASCWEIQKSVQSTSCLLILNATI
jgi:anthranilate synthase component I